jgi:DNA-binding transcriptional ArsR family regulator
MKEPAPNDIRAVRALAHPLRLRLLDLLRFDGPSTATLLARRIGESSGATSYHLRLLDRYGYIEEAPRGTGRERWWAYRPRRVTLPGQGGYDPGARVLLAELLSREAHALDGFLAEPPRADWDEAAFFQSQAFRLTAAELDELRRGIEALLARLRRADADDPPEGAEPVRVLAFGFPQVTEDTDERTG